MTSEQTTTLSPYRKKLGIMLSNRRWVAGQIDTLMRDYSSRWIVVNKCRVLADGDTAEAAIAACDGPVDEVESIVLLVPDVIPRPI